MTAREVRRVRTLLAGTNPVERPEPGLRDPADEQFRGATLLRILAEPVGLPAVSAVVERPRAHSLARVALAGAVAVAALVAFVVLVPVGGSGHRSGVAYAATPPVLQYSGSRQDARQLLLGLATVAGRQPEPRAGRYDFIRTRGWYLDSRDGSGQVVSTLDATERDQWTTSDGSGRIEEIRAGVRTDTSRRYGPGGLAGPQALPTDPQALRAELGKSHPDDGAFEWLTAVNDVWTVQVVGPTLQRSLLLLLAATPDLRVRGDVVDRVGRPGVAITTRASRSGLATDYSMIFDQNTGALLDFEQVVLEAGALRVLAPATMSYTVWLRGDRVPDVETRP